MKKKHTTNKWVVILSLLIIVVVLQQTFALSGIKENKDNALTQEAINSSNSPVIEQKADENKENTNVVQEAATGDQGFKITKNPQPEIDISKKEIPSEIESIIKNADAKNAEKNIKNYKTLLVKLEVPEQYENKLNELIKAGNKLKDILITYEYLYENYGKIEEIDQILSQRKSNESWTSIFTQYNQGKSEFMPSSFNEEYLENLLKTPGITPDDVMIADRLSSMKLKPFEELIEERKEGKDWKDISVELGMVNTSDKLPRVAVNGNEVQKYIKDGKISEDQVIEAMVIASKVGKQNDEIIKALKAGKKKEELFAQYYDGKY